MLNGCRNEETEQEDGFAGIVGMGNLSFGEKDGVCITAERTCSTKSPLQTTTVRFRSSG